MQRTICTFTITDATPHTLVNGKHTYTCPCVVDTPDRSASREYFVTKDPIVLETKVLDWTLTTEYPKEPTLCITPERELSPGHYYFVALGDIVEAIIYDEFSTFSRSKGTQEN